MGIHNEIQDRPEAIRLEAKKMVYEQHLKKVSHLAGMTKENRFDATSGDYKKIYTELRNLLAEMPFARSQTEDLIQRIEEIMSEGGEWSMSRKEINATKASIEGVSKELLDFIIENKDKIIESITFQALVSHMDLIDVADQIDNAIAGCCADTIKDIVRICTAKLLDDRCDLICQ